MQTEKLTAFQNRLSKVWKHYSKIARKQQVSCFRFYDHDMPEFPFAIEMYGDVIYAAEYKRKHGMDEETHAAWLKDCLTIIQGVTAVAEDHIFLKQRYRISDRTQQYEKLNTGKVEKIVEEGGLKFIVNMSDYLDTGLFLDHRITRGMLRAEAEGKRVLNLFCYTGSFSVYAAAGGASHVISVDMSRTYINWAKRNMQFNKLYDPEKHEFIEADVLALIEELPEEAYDLIICDPPSFSNSKKMSDIFDVQRDHVMLIKKLLKSLRPEGEIIFSNNLRDFELEKDKIPTPSIKNITGVTTPFDFQGRLYRQCYEIRN